MTCAQVIKTNYIHKETRPITNLEPDERRHIQELKTKKQHFAWPQSKANRSHGKRELSDLRGKFEKCITPCACAVDRTDNYLSQYKEPFVPQNKQQLHVELKTQ